MKKIDNPGSFRKHSKLSIKSYLSKLKHTIKKRNIQLLRYFLILETLNYFNQRKKVSNYYCCCCNSYLPSFIHRYNKTGVSKNSACPICDSRKRHRGLYIFYKEFFKSKKIKIIHFAPEQIFEELFAGQEYYTSDLYLEDVDYTGEDLQNLSFNNEIFDVVICNHVLEHIEEDQLALKEVSRILTNGGVLLLTVPGNWSAEKTQYYQDLSNNGHYRNYGKDIKDILAPLFKVEIIDLFQYNNKFDNDMGLEINRDLLFKCTKIHENWNRNS